MGLKCGIVGLPNVGKSTLFNALCAAKVEASNYPFCTIEPNVGIIPVPDQRLQKLASLVKPEKITPAAFEIADIAGLVRGASKGEGLGNQFLSNIREVDAIIHVVRCFESSDIMHVHGSVDPVRDKEIVDTELQLKDIDSVERKIQRYENMAKGMDQEAIECLRVLRQVKEHLSGGNSVRTFPFLNYEKKFIRDIFLLTDKPVLYLCNVDEKSIHTSNLYVEKFMKSVQNESDEILVICAEMESQIASLDNEEEKQEFMQALSLDEPGLHKVIRSAYRLLNYITFFTAGPKEVRAWTVVKGVRAPQAAGVIHSDFEKGFIRAEVISFEDYVLYQSEAKVKEAGKIRIEGKDYVVRDGDVIYFRFNV